MKVVFLDIDGVLTTAQSGWRLIREKVELLNRLEGWSVVISSSWCYCDDTVRSLQGCGLELPIIGGTRDWWIEEVDRAKDIRRWIEENKPEEWIVLDDEELDIEGFVHVDSLTGLTEKEIEGY